MTDTSPTNDRPSRNPSLPPAQPQLRRQLWPRLFPPGTVLAAFTGGTGAVVFWYLGLPAPFLLGPMLFTLITAMSGVTVAYPRWLQTLVMGMIGISVGSTLSPDNLQQMMAWLPSVVGGIATQMVALGAGCLFIHRVSGESIGTALLASYPGHLTMVLGAVGETNADSRIVAIAQSLRVVTLAVFVPFVMGQITPVLPSGDPLPFHATSAFVVVACGLVGMAVALLVRLPSPFLLGGIVGAGAATLDGHSLGAVPSMVGPVLLGIVGTMIGVRFSGTSRNELLRNVPRCVMTVAVVFSTTALLCWPFAQLLEIPFVQMLLAYCPGGGDVMPLLALSQGYNAVYVGVHHGARLLVMGFLLPLIVRLPPFRRPNTFD